MQLLIPILLAIVLVSGTVLAGDPGPGTGRPVPGAVTKSGSDPFEYPGVVERALGQGMRLNGVPVAGAYFVTKDDLEQVASFYKAAMERQGLLIAESGSPGRRTLVGVRMDGSVAFSVNMYSTKTGSLVFPSRMDLRALGWRGKNSRFTGSTQLPVPPGASGLVVVDSDDRGVFTEIADYRVPKALDESVRFFEGQMKMKGFRLVPRATSMVGASAVMTFAKQGAKCTITVTWDTRTRTCSVHAVLQRGIK